MLLFEVVFSTFWGQKNKFKFFKKHFSVRIEKLHKMAFIIFFFFFWKSFKKLKKLELSPLNSRYGVLHLLYSGAANLDNFGIIFLSYLILPSKSLSYPINHTQQPNFHWKWQFCSWRTILSVNVKFYLMNSVMKNYKSRFIMAQVRHINLILILKFKSYFNSQYF